jgi:hypothetical protein
MEQANTTEKANHITMHPSDLLRCVAGSMNWKDTGIFVTVPIMTTWKTVLRATDSALGEVDREFMVTYPRTEAQQLRRRQIALQNVEDEKASSSSVQSSPGRPIRTKYDIMSLPSPKHASDETRKRLKENAKLFDDFRKPYPVILPANITEKTLPTVKANVRLVGIDSKSSDPEEELKLVDMLWDTGAQQTIITEELLSESFRRYLQDPIHDPYRSSGGLRVQLDALVAFSNAPINIPAIVMIVPKSVVPNQRVGILFGQQQCIDRIGYRSFPRHILKAKGEEINEEVWGDFVIDEFVNEDGDLVCV